MDQTKQATQPTPAVKTPQSATVPVQPSPQQQNTSTTPRESTGTPPAAKMQSDKRTLGKKHPGALLITRTQLFVYVEGMQSVVVETFTPDVVRDLDVLHEEVMHEKIKALIAKHVLPPANYSAVLANQTLFSKQVTMTDPEQKKITEEKFLDTIPFDTPAVSYVKLEQNTYIVVANKQLFGPIDAAFEKEGSDITLVLPEFLFPKELNLAQGLSVSSAEVLLKKAPTFKEFNFIKKDPIPEDESMSSEVASEKKFQLQVSGGKSNKKLIIGGTAFMVLGVIFAVFLLMQQNQPPPVPPSPQTNQPAQILQATPIPQDSGQASDGGQLVTPGVQGAATPTVLINYQANNAQVAQAIRARLLSLGYPSVELRQINTITSVAHIAYAQGVSDILIAVAAEEVRRVTGDVRTHSTSASERDIIITLNSAR